LYITSGRNILTIDISSFSIIYEISTGFDDRTSVGFTTDYQSLYVASKQGIHWGFSQFSLPNLGYIGWHQVDGLQLCVPSNATFYYGETYWCDGVGEENSNIAICYGQVYKPKKQYKIYQINLNTWTSSAYTTGYLMSTTKIKNPGVFFTRGIGRNLLVEGVDINLDTEWVTKLPYEEFETGIASSENYVFVTGRIWDVQSTGTMVRVDKSNPSNIDALS